MRFSKHALGLVLLLVHSNPVFATECERFTAPPGYPVTYVSIEAVNALFEHGIILRPYEGVKKLTDTSGFSTVAPQIDGVESFETHPLGHSLGRISELTLLSRVRGDQRQSGAMLVFSRELLGASVGSFRKNPMFLGAGSHEGMFHFDLQASTPITGLPVVAGFPIDWLRRVVVPRHELSELTALLKQFKFDAEEVSQMVLAWDDPRVASALPEQGFTLPQVVLENASFLQSIFHAEVTKKLRALGGDINRLSAIEVTDSTSEKSVRKKFLVGSHLYVRDKKSPDQEYLGIVTYVGRVTYTQGAPIRTIYDVKLGGDFVVEIHDLIEDDKIRHIVGANQIVEDEFWKVPEGLYWQAVEKLLGK